MDYNIPHKELVTLLQSAEKELLSSKIFKFERTKLWRQQTIPDYPGVYCLYEKKGRKYELLYVGESGSLRERMSDICRTVNHTFRRQIAKKRFNVAIISKRTQPNTEQMLDNFFDTKLYISFIRVNFGRTEIEAFLAEKYKDIILNAKTKRKLKLVLTDSA